MPRERTMAFAALAFSVCVGTAVAGNGTLIADCQNADCFSLASDPDEQLHLMQINARLSVKQAQPIPAEEEQVQGNPAAVPAAPAAAAPTPTFNKAPTSGAEASGVTLNGEGDLQAFLAALVANLAIIVFCIAFFMLARSWFPVMYCNNIYLKVQPYEVPDRWFGWARAALGISIDEIAESMGLDQAMLIEFAAVCMRILAIFGLPMLLIMGPMNYAFGGNAAGDDYLSYLSMGNVEDGSWLYWVYAGVVWAVVFTVRVNIFSVMNKFMNRRIDWLQTLPLPRAATIMVEGIPEEHQTDERLRVFFSKLFGVDKVKSAYVAKRAPGLQSECLRKEIVEKELSSAKFNTEKSGKRPRSDEGHDILEALQRDVDDCQRAILEQRAEAKRHLSIPGGINGCNGFVTFHEPADADVALCMQIGSDGENWVLSIPPPPTHILWRDLQQDPGRKIMWTLLGYSLTFALYMLYLPSVIWITTIANKIELPMPYQSFWEGLAPTMGLLFMVSFLPTFLVLIFRFCFTMNDEANVQRLLQNWYFVFQFVFVIMITAIGDSLLFFMRTLVVSPLDIMPILANTMPFATHFYMDFMVLSWASHAMNLTRYVNIGKFLVFRKIMDEGKAVPMSEPEDQDYYGLGARHARFAIMMCIGIIFGTLSPPVAILTFINFLFCRLFYGYLIPFAETKKPDIGGGFFVQACEHLFVGCVLYVLLMTGVLYARAANGGPALIAVLAVFYVLWSMNRFGSEFQCDILPFEERLKEKSGKKIRNTGGSYIQPEWIE
mmetsp:Transcript_22253/g.39183  ORF Transcript_22253/g.39183 Transcript_22253/m.39183 type:complete len:775 (+) Transcript_22253:106-2430(+)